MKSASLVSSAIVLLALFHGFSAVSAEDLLPVDDDDEQGLLGRFLRPLVSFLSSLASGGISSDEAQAPPTRGDLVDNLFKRACDSTFSFLGVQDAGLNCLCEGDLAGDGMTQAIATCSTPTSRCITTNEVLGETICGAVVLDGVFSAENGRDLRTYVNACITIDVATSWLAGYDYEDPLYEIDEPHAPYHLCVSVQNSPDDGGLLDFVSCVATLDGQSCTCQLCEVGVPAVTLDCSNVAMPSSEKTYHGPTMNVCSRLDFSPLE